MEESSTRSVSLLGKFVLDVSKSYDGKFYLSCTFINNIFGIFLSQPSPSGLIASWIFKIFQWTDKDARWK